MLILFIPYIPTEDENTMMLVWPGIREMDNFSILFEQKAIVERRM